MSFVQDEAGIFVRDAALKGQVSSHLQELNDKYGLPVYLMMSESFLTSSVQEAAQEYYEAWLGKGADGIVIYYDRDSRSFGDGRRFKEIGENAEEVEQKSTIPDYIVQDIFDEINSLYAEKLKNEAADLKAMSSASYVEGFISDFAKIVKTKLAEQSGGPVKSKGFNYFWLLVPVALLGCAFFWGLQYFAQRNAMSSREEFWFPKVLIGTRLGARFGGGKASEISFGEGA